MSPSNPSNSSNPSRRGGGPRRRPPPTRMRPGARRPGRIPSGKRGQVRRSRRSVGGDQVEGRQAVRELLLGPRRRKVREVWIANDAEDTPILGDIRELAADARVPVRDVGRGRSSAQARCEAPQGVLALAGELPDVDLDDLIAGPPSPSGAPGAAGSPAATGGGARPAPFLVALDGVTDPGNLGAVLRSAECAGATGVVLPRHRAVHVTPAATKAAAGAIEHLPIALVGGLPAALARMRDAGVLVVGLDGGADRSLDQLGPADGPVCLVLGAEGRGLSRLVRQRCDDVVAIPLHGHLGSLNVAAAAAVACFEIARHRRT
jgi:23S rRNA (guanosine2251-2'-O)-methyltransferase